MLAQLGGFSPADKFVLKNDASTFVRKIIYKTVENKQHVDKLKAQVVNLRRQYFLWKDSTPLILNESENADWYFYDMEYLDPSGGWELLEKSNEKDKHVRSLLAGLLANVYCFRKKIDGVDWLEKHIAKKISPRLSSTNKELEKIFLREDLVINGRKTKSLKRYIGEINYLSFMPNWICPIHGDLTFENILVNTVTGNIKTIDPDGSDFYDAPELDLGKMCQSLKMKYSTWSDSDWYSRNGEYNINERLSDNSDSETYETLISAWADILVENNLLVRRK